MWQVVIRGLAEMRGLALLARRARVIFDEGFWDCLVQEPPRHVAGKRPPFCLRLFGSGDLTALLCEKKLPKNRAAAAWKRLSWGDVHRSVIIILYSQYVRARFLCFKSPD